MTKLLFVAVALFIAWRWWTRTSAAPKMTRSEAAKLLGLGVDASNAEVTEAHRRLIAKVHPDQGGTTELASQINAARAIMIQSGPNQPN